MKTWEIWVEGYSVNGNQSVAYFFGTKDAESFKNACDAFFSSEPKHATYYRPEDLHYWGCKLYDNEADARRSFG